MGGKLHGAAVDLAISALARRQHDLVARAQLLALGISGRAIDRRLERGRLRPVHRGVYTVRQTALGNEGRWMAAVLLGGDGAVLSHRSAAAHWGIRRWAGVAETTLPHRRRQCKAVRFHYGQIAADEITTRHRIPTTGVSRTVFDLAAVEPPSRVEAAMAEADAHRLTDAVSIDTLLERYPRRKGAQVLRAILKLGAARTRSELEIAFLELLDLHGLPRPETNVWLGEFEVDCLWRDQRVIVELDSREFHDTAAAFEADRERDRKLAAAGWRVIRITWRHLSDPRLVADLRALLLGEPLQQVA